MRSSKKNKKPFSSPKADKSVPIPSNYQEQEIPASPGRTSSKPGFLSRFRSKQPSSQDLASAAVQSTGRITPEQAESRTSSEKQKSRDNSPKSNPISLASSTYRSLSQSFTDLAAITSRSKPSSPDIDPIVPPSLVSPRSAFLEGNGPQNDAKPIQLPFKPEQIQRQGWLNKRPESDFRKAKAGSVWKLQRAILHEQKLYLYNPPSSLGIKAFSPNSTPSDVLGSGQHSPVQIKHSHSPSEGLATHASSGQLSLEDLGPRPATAPNAVAVDVKATEDTTVDDFGTNTIRLDDDSRILRGSVTAICQQILCNPPQDPSEIDEDCRIFCLTAGFWAPVELVFTEMTRIAAQKDVHVRLETIIRFWCNNTPRILWEDAAKDVLLLLIEEGVTRIDKEKGQALDNFVLETHKSFKELVNAQTDSEVDLCKDEVEASGLADQGLTGNVLLKIPIEVMAEQLFIYHLKYLVAVDPANDMSLLLDRSSSQRARSPLVFSPQSPHFLTRLVYTHVLGLDAPEAGIDVSLRAKYISRWIAIGQELKTRGDLASFLAIAIALLSMPILRLKETWTDVDVELRSLLIRDWSPMMKDLHRRELGIENNSSGAHVLTPDLVREDLDSHLVIPYYGDISTALEGFMLWATTPETDVDFVEIKEAVKSVEHAIRRWNNFKEIPDPDREPIPPSAFFEKRSRALQLCFEDLHTTFAEGFPYTSEQLFEASIQAEPPSQGAYIEHHYAKRISVTSGSYVPLMLTDILPSYKLFEQTDLLEALATVEKRALYAGSQTAARLHRERPTSPASSSAWSTPAKGIKPSPLRRTNSYPPSRASLATTGNPDLDYSTHNRIAGLTSRHFPMLKILRDIAGVEQSLLHVQDGELVLKVVKDTKRLSRPGSVIIETSSKRASMASKRSSAQVLGTPSISTPPPAKLPSSARNSFHPELFGPMTTDVVTKAGSLDRLVDILVLGIEDFNPYLLEEFADGKKPGRLQMNMDDFRTTFLATFRSFCSPTVLLEYLRKRFGAAVYVSAHLNDDESDAEDFSESFPDWTPMEPLNNDNIDWALVAKIQCGVLETVSLWIGQYFSDFLNTPNLGMELVRFLAVVQHELVVWDELHKTKPFTSYFSSQISTMSQGLRKAFTATFYRPTYYATSFRTPEATIFMPSLILTNEQKKRDMFTDLFNELDESLLLLYQQVSMEDWMAAFELFEIQSTDIIGFYNPNTSSPVREEDLRLRTIFTIVSQLQRPKSRGPLISALPKSLRQLYRIHENLTAWIIAQLSDTSIGVQDRATRILSLITFLRSSRQRMSYLDFYSSEQTVRLTEERMENRLGVPSFIASAVATALVSPESRAFGAAWSRVFEIDNPEGGKGQNFDSLAEFVHRKSVSPDPGVTRTLTPCLGWIIERMLEIACYVPNMSLESTRLINFDKRRYIFNLISNIVPAPDTFDFLDPTDQPIPPNSFALQLIASDLLVRRMDLRAIREVANFEWGQSEHKTPKLFRTLVADEQRKNRRDQRRRGEIEKLIRDHQKARPLGIREAPSQPDLREAARTGQEPKSIRGAKGMFLRTIRPLSIAISSNPFSGEKQELRVVSVAELPKTLSIPPGTRPAQKLPLCGALVLTRMAYEKECVFSIRTEDGQECWLQGEDPRDTLGWVQLLSSIATSSSAKEYNRPQKEVLPEPQKASEPVFGVKLETLIEREGKEIPWVVDKLLTELESRGLNEIGLYRVPGSVASVKALQAALNAGDDIDMDDDRWIDINVIAGTFKSWLRELPESILTTPLYDKFVQAVVIQEFDEKFYAIRNLVHQLPTCNFNLLKRLIQHLKLVADNESVNHMNAPNLAICVAPVIIPQSGPATFAGTMESMGRAQGLLRDLILQCDWIFEDDDEVAEQPGEEIPTEPELVAEESIRAVAQEEGEEGPDDPVETSQVQHVSSI